MDLRNGQITIRELLQNPRVWALMQRELPMLTGNPMIHRAGNMTLNSALGLARQYVSPQKLSRLVMQLKSL